jgi:cysteine sulfinate desulfinase/cysteine desulfurase-like protein
VDPSYGLGTLRLSFGRHTDMQDIDDAVRSIASAVDHIRSQRER